MRSKLGYILGITLCVGAAGHSQETIAPPLNVIDWLDQQNIQSNNAPHLKQIDEPEVTVSGTVPDVTVAPLDAPAAKRIGLAPARVTGLPDSLWSTSDAATLVRLVDALPEMMLPALQSMATTLLVTEADPPTGNATAFDLARVDALSRFGALDPARAFLEQMDIANDAAGLARFLDLSLIDGDSSTACGLLRSNPRLSPSKGHDIFCAARAGDWDNAALILGTGRALGLIEDNMAQALERFLDPDLFESEPPLPLPTKPDPLSFQLFGAIGTPIPTRGWPVLYANADLSPNTGWKTQIEAAERLAARGALSENRLLGLYTQRQAAASGGVWDRVTAVQRFETALNTHNPAAVSKTLPAAWQAMGHVGLKPVFASLFAEQLSQLVLSGPTADIAFEVILLSSDYERAATVFPGRGLKRPVLSAIAAGRTLDTVAADGVNNAVLVGFSGTAPQKKIVEMAQNGALGAAIVAAIDLTHNGTQGDVAQLTAGLATLRALGLEDVARRTALQVLLLGKTG